MTDNVRSTTHAKSSTGKEIKIPGPDHPITISPALGKVSVTVAGRIVTESAQALRLAEKGIRLFTICPQRCGHVVARSDQHYIYRPYKGDCTYYKIPIGGSKSECAVWTKATL
jgi:uncharacterized protein (DUF427 family)